MNDSPYIVWPGDRAGRDRIGGKAAALDALAEGRLPVPAWFALTPRAFVDSLPDEARQTWNEETSLGEATRNELALSPAVQQALAGALCRLAESPRDGEVRFAVRSSAPEEDAAAHSFAGQLDSFLGVSAGDVTARVADVWRSAFAEQTRAYRRTQGLAEVPPAPAVLVQRMVRARSAGAAFSADPASGKRGTAVVSAVHGLGAALVDGEETGDTYHVDRTGTVTERDISRQRKTHRLDAGTGEVHAMALSDEESQAPALTDAEARRVAALARQAERRAGRPQDIEWAFDAENRLHLLQSRPITTLRGMPDPDAPRVLWDDSNIAESYGGVTTPLTFSFARRAYRAVYRAFCRALGVPRAKIEAKAGAFRSMIGLVRGRLYYNLRSWYEVLRLLPGFRFNRAFMEDMMGVRERLPEDLLPERKPASLPEKARDAFRLACSAVKLVQEHRRIGERARAFRRHVDRTLAAPTPGVEQMRLDELAARYRRLEDALLGQWEVPIINDFLTMVFFGLSRRLLAAWVPEGEKLHGQLLAGAQSVVGAVVSAEPARRIGEMAEHAARDEALMKVLANGARSEIEEAIRARATFRERYEAYLDRFGDRCLGELKLESRTLREDPLPLLRAVAARARRLQHGEAPSAETSQSPRREEVEAKLAEALRGKPVRHRIVRWSLRHARARIATRENLRFERTRVFGAARRLFLEMGRRLAAEGVLGDARDVFYLEVEELLDFTRGTATTTDLAGLVAVRKEEFARHRARPAPPGRFTTRGAVPVGNLFEEAFAETPPPPDAPTGDRMRTGQGCGGSMDGSMARGPVCVVDDPREATLTGDEILVARQTDPGWTPLFAACRGVVVERGNLLSHAAVVAREMGLPAVVGVEGATHWLRGAGQAEVDGRAGTVRILDGEAMSGKTSQHRAAEVSP